MFAGISSSLFNTSDFSVFAHDHISRFCPIHIYRILYYVLDFLYLRVLPSMFFISFLSILFVSFIPRAHYYLLIWNSTNKSFYKNCLILHHSHSCILFLCFSLFKYSLLDYYIFSVCWFPTDGCSNHSLYRNCIHLYYLNYKWYATLCIFDVPL